MSSPHPALRATPPEVVLWEIPERYLTQPDMVAPGTVGAAATPESEVLP